MAEVCNLHLPIRYTIGDIEYYSKKLESIKGAIPEVACGTGRVLVPLLESGYPMEGLDHSPEMLEICQYNCDQRNLNTCLHHADMCNFIQSGKYHAIIVPAGSIRNIDGKEATLKALACFRESLISGGLLLIDVIVSQFVIQPDPMHYWYRDPYLWTTHVVLQEHDPLVNRTTNFIRYEKWKNGELICTEMHRFCLQHWSLHEFNFLLKEVGFENISITAGYKENNPFKSENSDWTFCAYRP